MPSCFKKTGKKNKGRRGRQSDRLQCACQLKKMAFNKNERVPDVGGPILFSKGTLAIREFMSRTAQDLYVP